MARGAATGSGKPNILFLMADQHRPDATHCAGTRSIRTPNLDWIARDGVRFRHAYSSTPSCTPARAGLLTGLSPWHHGMLGYSNVAERYGFEMVRALRDAGYYTIGVGKMHFDPRRAATHGFHQIALDESWPGRHAEFRSDYEGWFWSQAPHLDPHATGVGWNDYLVRPFVHRENLHATCWTAETAVNFLDAYAGKEPFFLKVSFVRPHSPWDPPARLLREYEDADLPPAPVGKWAARWAPRSSDRFDIWHGDLGAAQVRRSRQGYWASVTHVDEQIGRVLEALERRGWLENTLILYTSDHGDMTGDHHLWRKVQPYEASAGIPMLMRWPKGMSAAARGQVLDQPVELRDVMPTFLDVAGVSAPKQLDGRSLLDLVNGKTAGWRPFIDLEHDLCYGRDNHWSALTDGKVKYVYHALDGQEQLFNLERDPMELDDLAGDPGAESLLRLWRGRLVDHLSERGRPFVANGKLVPRPESMLHSPHYPGVRAPLALG
jgi:arylsulfatase